MTEKTIKNIDSDKILTIYFSITGNTKTIAESIHNKVNGDLVEIKTTTNYPIEYDELLAFAKDEFDVNTLPVITTEIEDISKYEVVFIGYPAWCHTYPLALKSFFEKYDLSDKLLIPFVTCGGGRSYDTLDELKKDNNNENVLEPIVIKEPDVKTSKDTVDKWLDDLGF